MDNSRPLVIAFLVAVVIFAGVVGAVIMRGGPPQIEQDRPQGPAALTGPQTAEAVATPGQEAARPSGADDPEPELVPPTFDIVRVDAAGTAVIAGRGVTDAEITLLANGEPLMNAEVDSRGEWVAIVSDPLPAGAVELALLMTADSGQEIRSDQVVVVSIPETRDTRPLVVLGRPGGPSEVLQSPFEDQGLEFALLAIDYDDAGGVIFTGRARPDASVRVIADGVEVGVTQADGIGRWSLVATSTLPVGRHELQIDQLEDGLVTAVIVVPFERVAPEVVAEAGSQSVIVQPGNSLWRIARRLYGSGWQYTVIYAANEDQIRDPDLIYPGQIFDVPGVDRADRG